MELTVGTKIRYASGKYTSKRNAEIVGIKVGPTAKPGFLNTWLTLFVPAQQGDKFDTHVQIPADNDSLKMFKVELV
jgi:hypothetical protein